MRRKRIPDYTLIDTMRDVMMRVNMTEKEKRMATEQEIDNVFTYHAPTPEQQMKYKAIREGFRILAHLINETLPECPTRTRVFNQITDTNMLANSAIALEGKTLR